MSIDENAIDKIIGHKDSIEITFKETVKSYLQTMQQKLLNYHIRHNITMNSSPTHTHEPSKLIIHDPFIFLSWVKTQNVIRESYMPESLNTPVAEEEDSKEDILGDFIKDSPEIAFAPD